MKDREVLEENLTHSIQTIKRKRNVINDIKNQLMKNDITSGAVQKWINEPEDELPHLDIRELFLFCEQVFLKTGDFLINPEDYFTKVEEKKARQYSASIYRDMID